MGAQTDKYRRPPDPARAREERDTAAHGPKRQLFCDHCHEWFHTRDLIMPPPKCPSCGEPWDHQRRWKIRMEGVKGARWPWAERPSIWRMITRFLRGPRGGGRS
jgi:NAD-dependent SIR2 family protein deacetylase